MQVRCFALFVTMHVLAAAVYAEQPANEPKNDTQVPVATKLCARELYGQMNGVYQYYAYDCDAQKWGFATSDRLISPLPEKCGNCTLEVQFRDSKPVNYSGGYLGFFGDVGKQGHPKVPPRRDVPGSSRDPRGRFPRNLKEDPPTGNPVPAVAKVLDEIQGQVTNTNRYFRLIIADNPDSGTRPKLRFGQEATGRSSHDVHEILAWDQPDPNRPFLYRVQVQGHKRCFYVLTEEPLPETPRPIECAPEEEEHPKQPMNPNEPTPEPEPTPAEQ